MSWQGTRERVERMCNLPALHVNRNMAFDLIDKLKDRVQVPTNVRLEQEDPESRPYLIMQWGEGRLMDRYTVMVMICVDGWGVFHRLKCTNVDREFVDEVALVLQSKIR